MKASDYERFRITGSGRFKLLRTIFKRALLRLLLLLVFFFNIPALQKTGRFLGRIVFRLARREREIALFQLSFCFPEKSEDEKHEIARKCFEHFCVCAMEFLALKKIGNEKEKWLRYHNIETLLNYHEKKQGCILLFSHFGNWELVSIMAETFRLPVMASVRGNDDPVIRNFITSRRENEFLKTLERDNPATPRKLLEIIRNKQILMMAIDIDTNLDSHFVNFFGRKAKTPSIASKLSLKYDFPIVLAYDIMDESGIHDFYFELIFDPSQAEKTEYNFQELTAHINLNIEKMIRKKPESWVWFHRRWRNTEAK